MVQTVQFHSNLFAHGHSNAGLLKYHGMIIIELVALLAVNNIQLALYDSQSNLTHSKSSEFFWIGNGGFFQYMEML